MTREELLKTVDTFYAKYNLPILKVSDGEWDALLNTLTNYLPNNVTDAVNIILRRAFNISMYSDCEYFTLYYVLLALKDLEVFKISSDEIEIIRNDIMINSFKNNTKKNNSITK